jgi:hypothetical protein
LQAQSMCLVLEGHRAILLAGLPLACVLIKCRSAYVFAIKKQG